MQNGKTRILILDNEEVIRRTTAWFLRQEGYEVFEFESKKMGLEWIVEIGPHLIISDLNSPEMNGYEFLEKIKSNPLTKDIPFVFFSGFSDLNSRTEAFNLGASDYLSKLLISDLQYLLTIVNRALRKE